MFNQPFPNKENQIQIRAKIKELKGRYSNKAQISFLKDSFGIDFYYKTDRRQIFLDRIIIPPRRTKIMLKELTSALGKWDNENKKTSKAKKSRKKKK